MNTSRDLQVSRRRVLKSWAAAGAASLAAPACLAAPKTEPPLEKPAATPSAVVEALPNGSEVHQVTTEPMEQSNIYCEVPYCSRDSRYFVYLRHNPNLSTNRSQLMVVEVGTWKQHQLDACQSISGLAISPDGILYYLKPDGDWLDLIRADLGQGKPERIYRRKKGPWVTSLGTITSDGRHYAGGVRVGDDWQMFGIMLLDLRTGKETIIDRDSYICNSHPQFEPGQGKQLMIQHNRGCKFTPEGKMERLVGPEGATLYVLSVPDGKRTELGVGKPYTTSCTGHEAWAGTTGEMILTVAASGDFAPEKGCLLGIRPGGKYRVVAKGGRYNHVGASRCGRFFSVDDCQGTYGVVIGSMASGKTAVICQSRTRPTRSQSSHVHPYLTPDLKWVIFNSTRTGTPHVYAASVPPAIIEELGRS